MAEIQTILFVDDDPICSYLNVALLKGLNIAKEVKALYTAEETLAFIQQHYSRPSTSPTTTPDIIFLDIRMPETDGFELLQELETLQHIDRSRFLIILLSATYSQGDKENAAHYRDYVYACLTKPLEEEAVQKLLVTVLMHQ